MNFSISEENQARFKMLFAGLLLVGLIAIVATAMVRSSPGSIDTESDPSGTRTAIALTSQALLGPFPTATAPSATASNVPSPTPSSTRTPTRTPTLTASPFVIVTWTAHTSLPRPTLAGTSIPSRTPLSPTNTPPPTTVPPTTYP